LRPRSVSGDRQLFDEEGVDEEVDGDPLGEDPVVDPLEAAGVELDALPELESPLEAVFVSDFDSDFASGFASVFLSAGAESALDPPPFDA
jgi:hypothetical protein